MFKINLKNKLSKSLLVTSAIACLSFTACDAVKNYDINHYDYVTRTEQFKNLNEGSSSFITFNDSKTESKVNGAVLNTAYAHDRYKDLQQIDKNAHFIEVNVTNYVMPSKITNLDMTKFALVTKDNEYLKPLLIKETGYMCNNVCQNIQTLIFRVSDKTEIKSLNYSNDNVVKKLKFNYLYVAKSKIDFAQFKKEVENRIDIFKNLWLLLSLFYGLMTFYYLKKKQCNNSNGSNYDVDLKIENNCIVSKFKNKNNKNEKDIEIKSKIYK